MTKKYKVLPIRFEPEPYRQLRKMAFLHEMSMAQLVRELVDKKLLEVKKILTNSDIVVS